MITLSCGCKFDQEPYAEYAVEYDEWHYPRTLEFDGTASPREHGRVFATWCETCVKERGYSYPGFVAKKLD